jgi:hypothetical protein
MLEVRYDVVVLEVTRGAPSNARADLLSRAASRRRPARAGASSVVEGRGGGFGENTPFILYDICELQLFARAVLRARGSRAMPLDRRSKVTAKPRQLSASFHSSLGGGDLRHPGPL